MYDIITIGEILVEILAKEIGQELCKPGVFLGPYPSGAPAICIDQAGRMGVKSAIIAKVGKDDFGKLNLERLAQDGVDVSRVVETAENSTGVAFNTYFPDGGRKFLFHFSHAACGELCAADVDKDAICDSKYLHIMGCSITGSPSLGEAIMQAVRLAKENGVKISFDPNIRPELLKGKIMDYYTEILECCDVLLTGKSELEFLFGQGWQDAVRDLLKAKERTIVVKDGSRGTLFFDRNEAFSVATYPATEVDPTGAGDCFDATFLSMVCLGYDNRTAVHYANAAGAHAVGKPGPMEGNTFKADLDKFLEVTPKAAEADIPMLY